MVCFKACCLFGRAYYAIVAFATSRRNSVRKTRPRTIENRLISASGPAVPRGSPAPPAAIVKSQNDLAVVGTRQETDGGSPRAAQKLIEQDVQQARLQRAAAQDPGPRQEARQSCQ